MSGDGFILTTEHFFDPIKKADGVNPRITAAIGGADSRKIPVKFVAELERLDLVLLRADIPFDMERPVALEIGSSTYVNRDDPPLLLTSGFHGNNYRKQKAEFNEAESESVTYAWSLNVKINSGQSGSPVYLEDGTVVGLIKATSAEDDELTMMIPIEYSMPLIGHFKIEELEKQITWLLRIVGEITDEHPPIHSRLEEVESDLEEIESLFNWSAESLRDGSVRIRYEKLIAGDPQIHKIKLVIRSNMRMLDANNNNIVFILPMKPLKMSDDDSKLFERDVLDSNGKIGEFLIQGVQEKLETQLSITSGSAGPPQPYQDLELTLIPLIDGHELSEKTIAVVPNYDWN